MTGKKALQRTPEDTVATALAEVLPGDAVRIVMGGEETGAVLEALEAVPLGFKVAVRAMAAGDPVIKYAHVIGRATRGIAPGACVHVHNIEGCRGRGDLAQEKTA